MKGWYEVRDMFCKVFGPIRDTEQSFRQSLPLLKHYDHPDALLLSSIIDETDTEEEIYQKLITHSDPIANVFATMINPDNRTFYLKQGAKKKHPLSQALLVYWSSVSYTLKQKHYDLIDMAKKSGDPYAFFVSGLIRNDKKEHAIAFELGWNGAAKYLFSNRIEQIEIYGKLASRGFSKHFNDLKFWLKTKQEYYMYGKYATKCDDNITIAAKNIYHEQNVATRKAVDTFAMCAKRLNICKDIRIYIGKMIWEFRNE